MDTAFDQIISILITHCGIPYEVAVHCTSFLIFEEALELGATSAELLYMNPPIQAIELSRNDYTSLYNIARAPPTRKKLRISFNNNRKYKYSMDYLQT
jgi:hypothetical protein